MEALEQIQLLISDNYLPVTEYINADSFFTTQELCDKLEVNFPAEFIDFDSVFKVLNSLGFKMFNQGKLEFVWGAKLVL